MRARLRRQVLPALAMLLLLVVSTVGATAVLGGPDIAKKTANDDGTYEVDFNGCGSVNIVADSTDDLPFDATITIYNASSDAIEDVDVTVTEGDTKKIKGRYGDRPVYQFDVHEYVGEPESGDSKILEVTIDDQRWVNENRCAENVPDDDVDPDKLLLTAICTDQEDDLAKFRVTNDNDDAVTVSYDVYGTDEEGTLEVPANDQVFFEVNTSDDGSATVRLFYDDEQVDVKASSNEECDLGEENREDAYQIDLAFGDVIENIGEDEDAFYGRQGRLIQARAFHENGTVTGSHDVPWKNGSATVMKDDCEVTYAVIEYDEETGEAMVEVSVAEDADCDGVQVTLAGYELPDGTTKFDRDRADEQTLLDHTTVMVDLGETKTLVIDLDD